MLSLKPFWKPCPQHLDNVSSHLENVELRKIQKIFFKRFTLYKHILIKEEHGL